MDRLKHNQPQVSVLRFNKKHAGFFHPDSFFTHYSHDKRWGQKPSVFGLKRNYNFKILHVFAFFLIPLDSQQYEFVLPNKTGKEWNVSENYLSVYLVLKMICIAMKEKGNLFL